MGLEHIAPHDLRRTCAKLCHSNGGELEQIQFLLGHASVLTTERYLGCKQNLGHRVNDIFELKIEEPVNGNNSDQDLNQSSRSVNTSAAGGAERDQELAQPAQARFFPTGGRRCRAVELDTGA